MQEKQSYSQQLIHCQMSHELGLPICRVVRSGLTGMLRRRNIPYLVHSNAGNAMVTDHENQAPSADPSSSSLSHRDTVTEGLQHAEFSAFKVDATSELSMFGFQDVSTSENGGLSLHQLPGHAWHASHDNEIGLDQVDSQRLISTKDAWALEDIIQQNCDDIVQQDYSALFDIQEDIAMGTLIDQADPAFWQM
jgi:hypothetical protein